MLSEGIAHCRVCGYRPGWLPWGETGTDPSWEFCPCCWVEFGYQDSSVAGARAYRQAWLASGATWSDTSVSHDGLTTAERLMFVPPGYE